MVWTTHSGANALHILTCIIIAWLVLAAHASRSTEDRKQMFVDVVTPSRWQLLPPICPFASVWHPNGVEKVHRARCHCHYR